MLTFGSLFAGIGGFDLGFERAGMKCKWQVEIDEFARTILRKHWPKHLQHKDIRHCGRGNLSKVDVICGGFPCQDISFAGPGGGLTGDRSGLWAEYFRVICELRPRYVVVENSSALLVRGLDAILCDFASVGFDAEWQIIQASDFALPHRRKRIFIVAYPNSQHGEARMGNLENRQRSVFATHYQERFPIWIQTASEIAGADDGVPERLYRQRVEVIGNSVAVPIAEWIGNLIVQHSSE